MSTTKYTGQVHNCHMCLIGTDCQEVCVWGTTAGCHGDVWVPGDHIHQLVVCLNHRTQTEVRASVNLHCPRGKISG